MHLLRKLVWWVVGLAAACGGIYAVAMRGHASSEEKPHRAAVKDTVITTAAVTARPVLRTVDVVGTLEGFEEVSVSPKVEGRVLRIHHEVGDVLTPGTALLDIDDVDYRLATMDAQRGMELELSRLGLTELPTEKIDPSKVPSIMRARNVEENARLVLDRARRLSSGRVIGAEELERVQMEQRVASAAREGAELEARTHLAAARQKYAQLQAAQQKLLDTVVRVPTPSPRRLPPGITDPTQVRYVVAARKVSEGEVVRVFPSPTLFKLVIDQPLKLVATVPERFDRDVQLDQAVSLHVEAHPDRSFTGKVTRKHPTIDRTSRTFTVEVTIPNSERLLRPGGFVKAAIQIRSTPRALTVPEECILRFAGVVKVFVADQGKVRSVPVLTGETLTIKDRDRSTRWIEVTGALREGDTVVTSGHSLLADGAPVRLRGQS